MKAVFRARSTRVILALSMLASYAYLLEAGHRW